MSPITAHQLRRLAEKADALRDEELTLVTEDGVLDVVPTTKLPNINRPNAEPIEKASKVYTTSDPGHPPLREVVLRRPTNRETLARTADGFDAVMWNESAVQKFVFPYYACTDSRGDFERVWAAYWAATQEKPIYAILHDRSRPVRVTRDARDGSAGASGVMVVTDPIADPRAAFGWRDDSPEQQRLIALAAEGIIPIEAFPVYLRSA